MKAGWARYAEASDKYLAAAGETRTVEQAEETFCKAVNKAVGRNIPAGHIQHFRPTLPATAKSLANERDRIRGLNPERRNAQQSKQTDQKNGGGRHATQMAIHRRQMRSSNRHIASIAA